MVWAYGKLLGVSGVVGGSSEKMLVLMLGMVNEFGSSMTHDAEEVPFRLSLANYMGWSMGNFHNM
jgi:hypothetical protein